VPQFATIDTFIELCLGNSSIRRFDSHTIVNNIGLQSPTSLLSCCTDTALAVLGKLHPSQTTASAAPVSHTTRALEVGIGAFVYFCTDCIFFL